MKVISKVFLFAVCVTFVFSSFSLVGCAKHPSAEQLQALEQQKNAALSAEKTLEERRREKSRLESELNKKKNDLQEAQNELETVKKRLGQ
ncbi:MAG: hypothetical protein ACE5HO_09165 [bacterium]